MNPTDLFIYLQQIKQIDAKYNQAPNPPALNKDIMRLKAKAWSYDEYSIPMTYEQILRYTNGIDFNGHLLYGSYEPEYISKNKQLASLDFGLANDIWEDFNGNESHNLVMFGESGISLYVHNRKAEKFSVLDRVRGDSYFETDTLDVLLERLFKDMLELE